MTMLHTLNRTAKLLLPLALGLQISMAMAEGFPDGQGFQSPGNQTPPSPDSAALHCLTGDNGPRGLPFEKLGLSEGQQATIDGLVTVSRQNADALQANLRIKRHALMDFLKDDDANIEHAREMNFEITHILQQLSDLRLETFFKVRSVLSPEQLVHLNASTNPLDGNAGRPPGDGCQGSRDKMKPGSENVDNRPMPPADAPRPTMN